MRKAFVVQMMFLCFILFGQQSNAEESIRVTIDNITQELTHPVQMEDHIMIPVKITMEALHATVLWDNERKQVHILNDQRALTIQDGNRIATVAFYDPEGDAYVNSESIILNAPPISRNGSIYMDIEDLKMYFDVKALWDSNDRVIRIFTDEGDINYIEYKRELEPDTAVPVTVATADKNGVQIQVGDTVASTGFYGHVERIEGDSLYVFWTGKSDLIADRDVPMMAFIAQINYMDRSWIKSSNVTVIRP